MTDREIIMRIRRLDKAITVRRQKDKLAHYNTGDKIHAKQMAFHRCPKRNRWVFGGNRSGKTECGAVEAVWMARGIHPYRENRPSVEGWVVSLSREVQRDVAQAKILSYINPDWIADIVMCSGSKGNPAGGVIDYILVNNVMGGVSKICFKSCEMGREKFQGASLDFVWFDEEPPEDIYDECLMRVIDRRGDVFGTMTPLKGLTFVYERIYLNTTDDGIWYEFIEWADNPYLDPDEIAALSRAMSADQLESRRYGKFVGGGGLVYGEFDPSLHVIPPFEVPKEWQCALSIDPGLNNPLSCHWYAVDGDGTVFVVAEHYEAGRDVAYHAQKIREISDRLDWHRDSFGRIHALIDSAANQKTLASIRSVTEMFVEQGIQVNPKVNKDLFSGINKVKQYLSPIGGKPRIYIFENCVNLIRELKSYRWGSGDTPIKTDDHCLDELRYFIMSRPESATPAQVPGLIERDKDRLISGLRRRRVNGQR